MNTQSLNLSNARLGIIGGTGLYAIAGLETEEELAIETPFGAPSDLLRIGRLQSMDTIFLARHGKYHQLLPQDVPYRANIWAMRSLGVRWLVSVSAVGSLRENVKPRDIVIPNQFIDRTKQRRQTFFGEGCVAHVSLADPFCIKLSELLADAGETSMPHGRVLHRGGTYLCMEGPGFSTRAESELYRSWGCSVIGMTNHTEASLAREAELAYASLSMVTDFDCWHRDHDAVMARTAMDNLQANTASTKAILHKFTQRLCEERPASTAHTALANALITSKNNVPPKTRRKLDLLTTPYWGSCNQS
ncbi:S-methyl-5'-thioadenosine phosphorylase [Synechococcus sp. M16CYN]|uniref:S-methyl-5'-thioadenosine phosphorylase n=1 Tax=Synechococcus sp. M16CYN TaxID=3103139 RepID=UPI00324697DF